MEKIIIILIAYLLGNFSTSYIVGKLIAKIDIRQHGSGNAGSTNVLRTLGAKPAAVAFIGDCLKGILAVYLAIQFGDETLPLIAGIAVVIGHNWPIFLGLKGGKGIATTIGVVFVIDPLAALVCVVFGVIILYRFRYVSLASISAISLLPLLSILKGFNHFLFGMILCLMAIYRHRENIQRLINGNERKIGERSIVK